MKTILSEKKSQILSELESECTQESLVSTMEKLDHFTVESPSPESTNQLIAILKPELKKTLFENRTNPDERHANQFNRSISFQFVRIFQMIQLQTMLLSKAFILISVLGLLAGLVFTNLVHGDTMKYLAAVAPILGISTLFYEFRAKINGVRELEMVCPLSPAQLATARLIIVLTYDILLCLAVTPFVSYWQGDMFWNVLVAWLAPLIMMLGIILIVSLKAGIIGGCITATVVWLIQSVLGKGNPLIAFLMPDQPVIFANLFSLGLGLTFILITSLQWRKNVECESKN